MRTKRCSTMDCWSTAIAQSKLSGLCYCVRCAIDAAAKMGIDTLITLPGAKFPWEEAASHTCPNCNTKFNSYLLGRGAECPACRKDLFKGKKAPFNYNEVRVEYEEGSHD